MTCMDHRKAGGFTLIEMAVVIAVIGLLLGSLLVPLATQVEERRIADTRRILEDAREALIGFAVANGRLPCPAAPGAATGVESIAAPPPGCTNPHDGFLPAVTLGLSPTDERGFAIDPWGNRIRYAVTTANSNAFTTANGISVQFLSSPPTPDLHVCSTGVSPGPGPSCAPDSTLTASAPAVLYSTGPNGGSGGTSVDEAQNVNNDRLFVSRSPRAAGAAGGEFDDMVTWISPNILYNRLIAAGKLP